jgi:hypothetical protein
MSTQRGAGGQGVRLVVAAYIITMTVVTFIAFLTISNLMMERQSCSDMSRALRVLWVTIAVAFLASGTIVALVAKKVIPSVAGRRQAVAVYGAAMLASYVFVACGLLVAFNC